MPHRLAPCDLGDPGWGDPWFRMVEQGHKDVHLEVVYDRSGCWFEVQSNGNGFHGLMCFDIILS